MNRIFIFIIFTMSSCTVRSVNSEADKNEGLKTVRKFFNNLDSANYKEISKILHPGYKQKVNTSKIIDIASDATLKYGKVQYRDLVDWRSLSRGFSGNYTEFQYQYKVRRDSLFSLELIELIKENDTTKMCNYEIQALIPINRKGN